MFDFDNFVEKFPELLGDVIDGRKHEMDLKNVTQLTCVLVQSSLLNPNEAVDKALYLYERIQAGFRV